MKAKTGKTERERTKGTSRKWKRSVFLGSQTSSAIVPPLLPGKRCPEIHARFKYYATCVVEEFQQNKKIRVTADSFGLLKIKRCAKKQCVYTAEQDF